MHIERIEIANKLFLFYAFVITEPTIRFYMISQLLNRLLGLQIHSSNMQSGLVTCSLEMFLKFYIKLACRK